MARKVVYIDDLTKEEIQEGDGGPVHFSLGDDCYEMDLASKSLARLTKALDPYISKASRVETHTLEPARAPRSSATTKRTRVPGSGKDYLDAVRRWARDNGHQVADRGRIAVSVTDAYEAAMGR